MWLRFAPLRKRPRSKSDSSLYVLANGTAPATLASSSHDIGTGGRNLASRCRRTRTMHGGRLKCLRKEPERRYASAEAPADLRRMAGGRADRSPAGGRPGTGGVGAPQAGAFRDWDDDDGDRDR
jgi:hypothetical protein